MKQIIRLSKMNTAISFLLIIPLFILVEQVDTSIFLHTGFFILCMTLLSFIIITTIFYGIPAIPMLWEALKGIVMFAFNVKPKVKKVKEKRNLWAYSIYYYLSILIVIPLLIGIVLTSDWTTNDIVYFVIAIVLALSQLLYFLFLITDHRKSLWKVLTFRLYSKPVPKNISQKIL